MMSLRPSDEITVNGFPAGDAVGFWKGWKRAKPHSESSTHQEKGHEMTAKEEGESLEERFEKRFYILIEILSLIAIIIAITLYKTSKVSTTNTQKSETTIDQSQEVNLLISAYRNNR